MTNFAFVTSRIGGIRKKEMNRRIEDHTGEGVYGGKGYPLARSICIEITTATAAHFFVVDQTEEEEVPSISNSTPFLRNPAQYCPLLYVP